MRQSLAIHGSMFEESPTAAFASDSSLLPRMPSSWIQPVSNLQLQNYQKSRGTREIEDGSVSEVLSNREGQEKEQKRSDKGDASRPNIR